MLSGNSTQHTVTNKVRVEASRGGPTIHIDDIIATAVLSVNFERLEALLSVGTTNSTDYSVHKTKGKWFSHCEPKLSAQKFRGYKQVTTCTLA